MLARTADNLFWLARYVERADYLARLLQVAGHMNAVRVDDDRNAEWESAIVASGARDGYFARHESADEETVFDYLAFDTKNPSSIACCIETARRNARAVRTALTSDMWEAINSTWQELGEYSSAPLDEDRRAAFLDWVKARVGLFHGVCANAMLRRDSFHFARLGQFLERADNTARLLDVKYHVRLPQVSDVGGVIDYYQWLAILRVVGARRAYRVLFKGQVEPARVAELLVLREEFPRSLAFCFQQITLHLDAIKAQDQDRSSEAKRMAHSIHADLRYARVENIISGGLHEYLTGMIERTDTLGQQIADGHLFQGR
ncbi:alpha-E domain-containing protein [Luteimonas vadosa]|uniref:Alpha-E domain-containing protein n=1 Tax=Luteimonas vadosa TaxID=1165507 RepID=A0ABP9E325_9GAMM